MEWRYDDPPKDGTVFLGYMDDGCYIVMWWVDCLSDDGDGNWEAEQSTIYNEPVAWCELTPPKETTQTTNERASFQEDLRSLINRHSKENDSNTPDFVLAEYLHQCLRGFVLAVRAREDFYAPPEVES